MYKIIVFSIFLLLKSSYSSPITSDVDESDIGTTDDKPSEPSFLKSNNELALDLLHTLSSDNNVLYSPLSISSSLLKLLNGAAGDTEKELRNLLHISSDAKLDEIVRQLKTVLQTILPKQNNENVTINVANRLYISNEFPVLDSYQKLYSKNVIESVDFVNKAKNVTKNINEFVAQTTAGKIPKLFKDSLPNYTKLALINAVYFFAKWAKPFDRELTTKQDFFNLGSTAPSVIDTMSLLSTLNIATIDELNSQLIELPYNGNNISMFILLPQEQQGIDELNEKLTLNLFNDAINQLKPEKIQLFFPKFKIDSEYDLSEPLEELEIKTLFNELANFTRISKVANLQLSSAVHRSYIDVNEDGTEAAAATGLVLIPTSLVIVPEVRVNRPFTFAIRDNRSGLILFMGQIRNLVDEQLLSNVFI